MESATKSSFEILRFEAEIEDRETRVEEHKDYLKYVTPKFKASATLLVPALDEGEAWQVGWIQACIHMKFTNTYGDGVSSWEFPELTEGRQTMISDSDGHYPWYGNTEEVITIYGKTTKTHPVKVQMEDNFFPRISWVVPIDSKQEPSLTRSERKQGFYSWLVARDMIKNVFYVLKTVYWEMTIDIESNTKKRVGQRSQLMGLRRQKQPVVMQRNVPMSVDALKPPNANSAQVLMYRSFDGRREMIVKPPLAVEPSRSQGSMNRGDVKRRRSSSREDAKRWRSDSNVERQTSSRSILAAPARLRHIG